MNRTIGPMIEAIEDALFETGLFDSFPPEDIRRAARHVADRLLEAERPLPRPISGSGSGLTVQELLAKEYGP